MMEAGFIWAVVIGMALANYMTRFPSIALFSRVSLPEPFMRWLSFIPASVMGALVALELFRPGGEFIDSAASPHLWAGLLTALAYRLTHSFLGATMVGMIAFVMLRSLFGQ